MEQKRRNLVIGISILLAFGLGGCSALQPVRPASVQNSSAYYVAPTPAPTATPLQPTVSSTESQPANCTNVLSYEKDLTLPDGTFVDAGSKLDKQWQVLNSGTCTWDSSYTLQKIDGDDLGATSPQTLAPARGGAEVTLSIQFTAPTTPGNYSSVWKAYTPDGQPFGDPITIVINVANK